jgi:hypothetical protein
MSELLMNDGLDMICKEAIVNWLSQYLGNLVGKIGEIPIEDGLWEQRFFNLEFPQ